MQIVSLALCLGFLATLIRREILHGTKYWNELAEAQFKCLILPLGVVVGVILYSNLLEIIP